MKDLIKDIPSLFTAYKNGDIQKGELVANVDNDHISIHINEGDYKKLLSFCPDEAITEILDCLGIEWQRV